MTVCNKASSVTLAACWCAHELHCGSLCLHTAAAQAVSCPDIRMHMSDAVPALMAFKAPNRIRAHFEALAAVPGMCTSMPIMDPCSVQVCRGAPHRERDRRAVPAQEGASPEVLATRVAALQHLWRAHAAHQLLIRALRV